MQRWSDAAFEQERLLGTIKHNPLFRDYIMALLFGTDGRQLHRR